MIQTTKTALTSRTSYVRTTLRRGERSQNGCHQIRRNLLLHHHLHHRTCTISMVQGMVRNMEIKQSSENSPQHNRVVYLICGMHHRPHSRLRRRVFEQQGQHHSRFGPMTIRPAV